MKVGSWCNDGDST